MSNRPRGSVALEVWRKGGLASGRVDALRLRTTTVDRVPVPLQPIFLRLIERPDIFRTVRPVMQPKNDGMASDEIQGELTLWVEDLASSRSRSTRVWAEDGKQRWTLFVEAHGGVPTATFLKTLIDLVTEQNRAEEEGPCLTTETTGAGSSD